MAFLPLGVRGAISPANHAEGVRHDISELINTELKSTGARVNGDVLNRLVEHIRKGSGEVVLEEVKEQLKYGTPEVQIRAINLLNECVLNSTPQFVVLLSSERWVDRLFKIAKITPSTQVRDRVITVVIGWYERHHTSGHQRLLRRFFQSKTLGTPFRELVKAEKSKRHSAASQDSSRPPVRTFDNVGEPNPNETPDTEETILLQCQGDLASLEYALEHPHVLQDDDVANECKEHKLVCMRMLESGMHEHIAAELMSLVDRLSEALELYEAMTGIDMGEGERARERALADEDLAEPDSDDDAQQAIIRRRRAPKVDAEKMLLQGQLQTQELVEKERGETAQLRQQLEDERRKNEVLQNKYKDAKAKNKEAIAMLEQYAERLDNADGGSGGGGGGVTAALMGRLGTNAVAGGLSIEQAARLRDAAQAVRQDLRDVKERLAADIAREARSYTAQLATAVASIVQAAQMDRQADQRALAWTQELYKKEIKLRKQYYNTIQELKGNIRVYCRVRPMLPKELAGGYTDVMSYPSTDEVKFIDAAGRPKLFEFDEVYAPDAPQSKVFEDTSPLIDSVVDGFNVCIFAYGQTGSGKTYTMGGGEGETKGINTRALERLFQIIDDRKQTETSTVTISVLEIYLEQINDLLVSKSTSANTVYEIKQGGPYGTYVTNLTEVPVTSPQDIYRIMETAAKHRSEGTTNMNEHSSRSHMILYIIVRTTNIQTKIQSYGKLSLVDLAGSERLDKSGAEGQLMKEAVSINKSLSALGDVIAGLSQNSKHIPFRNSVLTFLLQDSMAGQAKVLMFVCVSPASYNCSESGSSLQFASRARGVAFGQIKKNPTSAQK